jgi:23S rRNA pseudouridine1911/1915/1917 synthase
MDHPIVGDPVYRPRRLIKNLNNKAERLPANLIDLLKAIPRQLLHAWRLGFIHPRTGQRLSFESPLPPDMIGLMEKLRKK